LTTRIECSQTNLARSAEANQEGRNTGHTFAFHLLNPGSSPASAPTPPGVVTYSRCVTTRNCRSRTKRGTQLPWENAAGIPSVDGPFRHSFKMPITTTKLSKNKTSRPQWYRHPL